MNTQTGVIGRKVGMTQIFVDDGDVVPVTVIEAGPNTVLRVRTDDADGYSAVQLGYLDLPERHVNRPMKGVYAGLGMAAKRIVRELRLTPQAAAGFTAGQTVGPADVFTVGSRVDVTGTSKGRGFSGVMKRHNFKGFIRSHGTHEYFRHSGSIGTRLTPGRVRPGLHMSGHMGAERVTVQCLKVVRIDAERNLVYVRGGVPGPNGGYVVVRNAVKTGRK